MGSMDVIMIVVNLFLRLTSNLDYSQLAAKSEDSRRRRDT
jgi:hypothetical protein